MAPAAGPNLPPIAKFCAGCHQLEPGTMMGFLDSISTAGRILQMDFLTHKERVRFTDATTLKNVGSLEQIEKYRRKGFKIAFEERDGDKWATQITRFDILKTVAEEEKLSKAAFKDQLGNPEVAIYDVRPPEMYRAAHIHRARSLPAPAIEKLADRLPKDKGAPIVLYGPGGCLSPTTSLRAKALGYTNVKIYTRGFADWVQTEYSVTTPEWLKTAIAEDIPVVLIDVRQEAVARREHIPGAVSIPLEQLDASREQLPEQRNAPIVIYGADKREAAMRLVSWGYRAVRVLPITFEQWRVAGNPIQTGPTAQRIVYKPLPKPGAIGIDEFRAAAEQSVAGRLLVDVRNPEEVAEATIPNAINIPADQLQHRLSEIPADREPLFFCLTAVRAEIAYNILTDSGRHGRYLDAEIEIDRDGQFRIAER